MKVILTILIFILSQSTIFAVYEIVGASGIVYDSLPTEYKYSLSDLNGHHYRFAQYTSIYEVIAKGSSGYYRYNNKYLRVAIPPLSEVSYIYWVLNSTGENITLNSIDAFVSRSSLVNGDLTKFGIEGSLTPYSIDSKLRTSKVLHIPTDINLEPTKQYHPQKYISFKIPPKITLEENEREVMMINDELLLVQPIVVINSGLYNLCNLSVTSELIDKDIVGGQSGNRYSETFCLNKGESIEINLKHRVHKDSIYANYILKYTITDPNRHFESITSQIGNIYDRNLEGSALIFNSSIGSFQSIGHITDVVMLELIPYSINKSIADIKIYPQFETNILSFEQKSIRNDLELQYEIELRNVGELSLSGNNIRVSPLVGECSIKQINSDGNINNGVDNAKFDLLKNSSIQLKLECKQIKSVMNNSITIFLENTFGTFNLMTVEYRKVDKVIGKEVGIVSKPIISNTGIIVANIPTKILGTKVLENENDSVNGSSDAIENIADNIVKTIELNEKQKYQLDSKLIYLSIPLVLVITLIVMNIYGRL